METLTQTLADSIMYEKQVKMLARAEQLLELYKKAYQRHVDHLTTSEKEKAVLFSGKWRAHPFVTIRTQERAEHKAEISLMASNRILKAYKKVLFRMFCASKIQKAA